MVLLSVASNGCQPQKDHDVDHETACKWSILHIRSIPDPFALLKSCCYAVVIRMISNI